MSPPSKPTRKPSPNAFDQATKERLGTTGPRTPEREAMWDSDPEMQDWKRAQLDRAGQLAEWHDPGQLAAEIRDDRPFHERELATPRQPRAEPTRTRKVGARETRGCSC